MTLRFISAPVTAGGPHVPGFFDYDPWRADAGEAARRASAVDREWSGDRDALAGALVKLNRSLGAHPAAVDAAGRLAAPGALAVVAGQQAGLFTGPLYTVFKALGAVALARHLEISLGRPVVPVFWAATEDHDLEEADHAWLMDPGGAWQKIRYLPRGLPSGLSVGAVPLQQGPLEQVMSRLAAVLPGGFAGPGLVDLVWTTARAGREAGGDRPAATFGEWFCRLVAAILGPLGLPVADPMDPGLRALAAPGVRRILERGPAVEQALAAGTARVEAAGLAPQVRLAAGEANLFFYPQGPAGPRHALVRTGDGKLGLRGDGPSSEAAVGHYAALTFERPESFGGNVATRPLLQDEIFPTLAYIAGPGEVAYYGQYRELYHALGRTMPLIWHRPSLTLVTPPVGRLLERHSLEFDGLRAGLDRRRADLMQSADDAGAQGLLQGLEDQVSQAYEPVLAALAKLDGVLGKLAAENRRRVMDQTAWLAKKTRQVLRQRCQTSLSQLDRIQSAIWPRGQQQERVANILNYLAYCGPALVGELAGLPVGPPFAHHYAVIT